MGVVSGKSCFGEIFLTEEQFFVVQRTMKSIPAWRTHQPGDNVSLYQFTLAASAALMDAAT
ncbi:hypothetical protein CUJ91_33325 (plasmid) [Paraburkholderia graminis]|nr:hypothetical protein CUJ91_33325 [Paraburkholderia graminis]